MGIGLLAVDGIEDRGRLDTLLRRVVALGTVLAGIGILQFATGFDPVAHLRPPGLVAQGLLDSIDVRSSFNRVAGTARHPIEFGMVLAMVLPLALDYAFVAETAAERRRRWWQVGIVALAIPLSLSRSAILGVVIAAVILLPTWTPVQRFRAVTVSLVAALAMRFVVPGLLGTIRSMFVNITSDPSFQGRTHDYSLIGKYITHSPVFGRGFFTFIPSQYQFIDNQYLMTLIETGIVGLMCLLLFFSAGVRAARSVRRASHDPSTRSLANSLMASVIIAAVGYATFDALSFPMASGFTVLLVGCSGALWRIERAAKPALTLRSRCGWLASFRHRARVAGCPLPGARGTPHREQGSDLDPGLPSDVRRCQAQREPVAQPNACFQHGHGDVEGQEPEPGEAHDCERNDAGSQPESRTDE